MNLPARFEAVAAELSRHVAIEASSGLIRYSVFTSPFPTGAESWTGNSESRSVQVRAAGFSRHQMLGELLGLEEADVVEAALRYARRRVDHPVFAA